MMGPQTIDDHSTQEIVEFLLIFFPILIAYAICIWQASALATRKGRSRTKWTFRTVLFGPLALLVLAILPSRHDDERPRSRSRRRRS
jgi:hypothetical protein